MNPYSDKFTYGATARYTPYRAVAKESSASVELEGMASSYNLGGVVNKSFKQKFLVSLNADLGFMNLTMYPTDISENTDDELKKSGFAFTGGLTGSYLLLNKIAVGYKFSYTHW